MIVYVYTKSTEQFQYYFYAIEVKLSLNFKFIGSSHTKRMDFFSFKSAAFLKIINLKFQSNLSISELRMCNLAVLNMDTSSSLRLMARR